MALLHKTFHEPGRDVEKVNPDIISVDKVCRDTRVISICIDKVAEKSYGIYYGIHRNSWS